MNAPYRYMRPGFTFTDWRQPFQFGRTVRGIASFANAFPKRPPVVTTS